MLQSQLFTKTRKEAPKDEVAKNAQLLIKAGYINKEMAGVYDFLPLGIKVLEKIKQVVREEMNAIGGQEISMTSLQRKELWEKTDRWDDKNVDVWFKSELKNGAEIGFGWSHEEPITEMMKNFVTSYRDLPVYVYQFQNKLRNELRAKSGIMRGREFLMKDMYSLHATKEDMDSYYDKVIDTYKRIYERLGVGKETFVTFASGGSFTKFSHEFQTVCEAGEDILYVNKEKNMAVNEEVLEDATKEIGISKEELIPVKSAEVGNIFKFGTEKGEKMNVTFKDVEGENKPVYLASYGIGITRVMGVIVEKFADDKGIVWPKAVAPFDVHLLNISNKPETAEKVDEIYKKLQALDIEVLCDDREARAGEKFADSDLIGIPLRLIISDKNLEQGEIEVKERAGDNTPVMIKEADLLQFVLDFKNKN